MPESAKIVIDHYPADKLPEDIRRLVDTKNVRLTIEAEDLPEDRSLRSFIGAGKGVYASPEQAVATIRHVRDEWE